MTGRFAARRTSTVRRPGWGPAPRRRRPSRWRRGKRSPSYADRSGMAIVSRGFRGRRRNEGESGRVPPGQYLVDDFPVLSAGPTPFTPVEAWDFAIDGDVDEEKRWAWDE